ncbi:glycosyltransferase family 9 protein [Chryseobacterium sp. FH1]|uniref:glycosyltransferase family 9 protein n=1 Tax=Chryseobacterium sp. FH1 TaxID=1233951 RepID=UPI00068BDE95|nr:glycosyltransferase family 9 protein [Chryseobacterium sp. FH1]
MKILIIQKKHLGDILVSTVIFPLLQKQYPDAEITFLLNEKHHQILIGNPFVNHVIFWDKDKLLSLFLNVRKQKYDIVIDLYAKVDSGFLMFFSCAGKRITYFKKYTQLFCNFPIERSKIVRCKNTTLSIEHRLQTLEPLKITFEETFPKLYVLPEELQNSHQILSNLGLSTDNKLIMISTFGSKEVKTYPLKYMAKILDYISDLQENIKLLCNYLPFQKELFLQLYEMVSVKTKEAIVKNFDTQNLREFIAITSVCDCLIGNEGGATNISKSLDIPTFTIFAPGVNLTDWAWTDKPKLDKFLHVNDFVENSTDYLDFKPDFMKKSLEGFLNNVFELTKFKTNV